MRAGARSRGIRGRRRDRYPVAEGCRRRVRGLHGDARQGLRAARAPLLQALQAEGRRHRDRRLRRHPRTLRIRRSDARARRAGVVGRCLGQYSRRAGHRREGCLQAGADVGNGREHSLQRGADQGQAGREHRRVGRQIAACQEAHDDPAGRADRIPPRGVDDVSAQSGRTACAFRRTGFHDVPARSAKRGAARRERRAAAGPAASAGRDGTGQIGCRQEGGAGRAGRSLRAGRSGACGGSARGGR